VVLVPVLQVRKLLAIFINQNNFANKAATQSRDYVPANDSHSPCRSQMKHFSAQTSGGSL
jgi:hypothetical protein